MKTSGYLSQLPSDRPRIFAHRGFTLRGSNQIADENTLEAFDLALTEGADYIESDVQVTKDSIAVLFHDPTLKRLTGKPTKIRDLTLGQLQENRLPFGGKIPTLEQALSRFPGAKFNLDIKSSLAEAAAPKVINDLASWDRVLISSFSEKSRARTLGHLARNVASSPGSSKVLEIYLSARYGLKSISNKLSDLVALQLPTNRYGIDFTHPRFLEKVLAEGIELHFWTINDSVEMQELYELGAHGIVTDRTDLAVKLFS